MISFGRFRTIRAARPIAVVCVATLPAVVLTFAATPNAGAKPKGSTTTSSTTTSTTTTVPAAWDPRIQPIADKVAELRGLQFVHPVAAEFLDDAAFEQRFAAEEGKLSKQDKADLARAQAQLRAVGLLGPNVDVLGAVSSLQAAGVLAYYEPKTKKTTVKGTNLDDVSTRVTVAHELTHALQDQHFDLQKLDKAAEADHGSTALHAIAEGDAVRVEDAYRESLSADEQQAYAARHAEVGKQFAAEVKAKAVPDVLTTAFQAPYALGSAMVTALVAQDPAGVDALFGTPPVADATFVTPTNVLDHHQFQAVEPPALQPGEKRSGKDDQFGSFALYQMLAARLDNPTALSAADAWDGDSMVTFTRKDRTTCLRTTLAGRGTDGTAKLADALNRWAAAMPPLTATVSGTPDRVTFTACDPKRAATSFPNNATASFVVLASRDGVFSSAVKNGLPEGVAMCSADTLVRDPVFAPAIDASVADPTADPDPAITSAIQARLPQIVADCRAAAPS